LKRALLFLPTRYRAERGCACCSDDPRELPAFVGSNEAAEGCTIKAHGDNIFTALWCAASVLHLQTANVKSFLTHGVASIYLSLNLTPIYTCVMSNE